MVTSTIKKGERPGKDVRDRIRAARNYPPQFDKDSPKLSSEDLNGFRRVSDVRREKVYANSGSGSRKVIEAKEEE